MKAVAMSFAFFAERGGFSAFSEFQLFNVSDIGNIG
jgi:hypothetical protein